MDFSHGRIRPRVVGQEAGLFLAIAGTDAQHRTGSVPCRMAQQDQEQDRVL